MKQCAWKLAAIFAILLAGCSSGATGKRPISTMSQAQRDSAIARSAIPGSRAVARAFEVAGTPSPTSIAVDSLGR